ncbi:MAG: hypothetical protein EHM15_00355, partial [Desulfobacteraceae bacterium]
DPRRPNVLAPLPIDPFLPEIAARVRERRALVVVAPPGAGKTTRVPPALAEDGPLLLLQPRRIAARAVATRVASGRCKKMRNPLKGEYCGKHATKRRRSKKSCRPRQRGFDRNSSSRAPTSAATAGRTSSVAMGCSAG